MKSSLMDMITSQGMPPHTKLPTEAELCAEFGVSRTVVREALNQLMIEHRIYKIQGKGSFVAEQKEEQDFVGSKISFSGDFAGKNHVVSRRILSKELRAATAKERALLKLEEADSQVVALERVLSVDGVPRTIVTAILPLAVVPGMDSYSMENKSLYETLRRRYGIVLQRAERWIEAVNASEEEADLLAVAPETALLGIESLALDSEGRPVELYYAIHRTDQARLHFIVD
jgi:GntR family transcriptional regulator